MAENLINLFEYEAEAKKRMPSLEYQRIAGGAGEEFTLRRNREIYGTIMLRPKMLTDVSSVKTATTVLGHKMSFPVMLAPAGFHARAHKDGEVASVRAAGAEGVVMMLSSAALKTMEEVALAGAGTRWFQQYFFRDKGLNLEFANRAEKAGYKAICVTVDSKARPKRDRDLRNSNASLTLPNYKGLGLKENGEGSKVLFDIRDPGATFEDLEWLASKTRLPVIPKGVMRGDDARRCVEHGAKAVVVSNHGGGILDTEFSAIEMLPEVVEAVDGKAEVYVDGGIRRGSDIVKALALGARAVLIGRPVFWGLAVAGEEGVRGVLQVLREETQMTMAMCGVADVKAIDLSLIGGVSPLADVLSQPGWRMG
ncbi:MAG: alpha-hydroxy-acid oxidizing protein [SAR202 cluster bacterium]|nr:alpha-hydroxy-acid oxidizing protein [SAR202 cluster bacterium]